MSETAHFKVFCVERYKSVHNMKGKDTITLFKKYGVLDYLDKFYDILHTCGWQYIVQDIDLFIEARQQNIHQ